MERIQILKSAQEKFPYESNEHVRINIPHGSNEHVYKKYCICLMGHPKEKLAGKFPYGHPKGKLAAPSLWEKGL